jgi:heat shock protein HslJ
MTRIYPLIALGLIVAGCAGTPQATPEIDGNWQLESGEVAGQPLPLVEAITLQIDRANVSGNSACNQYSGQIVVDGSAIEFGDLISTLMGCEADRMEAESAYSDALSRVDTVALDGGDLVLSGPDAELRFTPNG